MQVRNRQKAKEQAKRDRGEKAKLETEQPGIYRHPLPFNTNPFWQEEISMGPHLPKKSASKNSSQRGLASSGRDSNAPSVSECTNVGDSRTNFGDSTTVIPEDDTVSDDWNRRHGYQREDEELWGQWSGGHKLKGAFSKARISAGKLMESKMGFDKDVTDQDRRDFYFAPRCPPVNDYHPPVVSNKVPHKAAHQWMLQPPPPAKVMEGKIPVSRAISTGSRSSGKTMTGEDVQLGRQLQQKRVKEKIMKENEPTEAELIESLFATRSHRSLSLQRSRSLSLDGGEEAYELPPFERRRSCRLRPADYIDNGDETPSVLAAMKIRRTGLASPLGGAGHCAQRPNLPTITSTESDSSARPQSRKSRQKKPARIRALSAATSPVGDDSD